MHEKHIDISPISFYFITYFMVVSNHFVKSRSGRRPTCKWLRLVRNPVHFCKPEDCWYLNRTWDMLLWYAESQQSMRWPIVDQGQVSGPPWLAVASNWLGPLLPRGRNQPFSYPNFWFLNKPNILSLYKLIPKK